MILVKTEGGQRAFKDRSGALTPRQRSAFILCDGKRTVDDVLSAGMGVAREDIDRLLELGMLGSAQGGAPPAVSSSAKAAAGLAPSAGVSASPGVLNGAASAPAAPPPASASPPRSSQQRYKDAYPLATQLTASLGLRGFRLNLAVEGTSSYEQLLELFPKIQAAVGAERAAALQQALSGH